MSFLNKNTKLKNYVIDLAIQASKKSTIHPVDRHFLAQHLDEILVFDRVEFIYHNLELENDLYTNQLFVCLPEVWQNITFNDMLEMSEHFSNVHSYFTLIRFTYKYLEIDIIEPILKSKQLQRSQNFRDQILEYLHLQWNVLLKSESDLEDFEDGFIDVNYDEWMYIKQKILLDKRVKHALLEPNETREYITMLVSQFKRN